MRKLLLLSILLIFISVPGGVYAVDTLEGTAITKSTDVEGHSANIDDVEGQPVAAAAGDCDWSAAAIGWNAEAGTNTDACEDDDSTISGTLSGATIVTDPDTTYGDVLFVDADNDYISWPVTTGEVQTDEGFCRMRVRSVNQLGPTYLWSYPAAGGSPVMTIYTTSGETLTFYVNDGSDIITMATTDTICTDASCTSPSWHDIYWAWNASGDLHSQGAGVELGIKIGTGSWLYDNDSDDFTAFTEPLTSALGRNSAGSHNANVHIEGHECWPTETDRPY